MPHFPMYLSSSLDVSIVSLHNIDPLEILIRYWICSFWHRPNLRLSAGAKCWGGRWLLVRKTNRPKATVTSGVMRK
jgi:hypothetical protein